LTSANAVVDAGVVCGQFITSFVSAADAKRRRTLLEASTVGRSRGSVLQRDPE
jgi:hypothetical protein